MKNMKGTTLHYIWIDDYKCFHNQEIRFTDKYSIEFRDNTL